DGDAQVVAATAAARGLGVVAVVTARAGQQGERRHGDDGPGPGPMGGRPADASCVCHALSTAAGARADLSTLAPGCRWGSAREVGRDPIGPPERTEGMWDVSDEALFAGFASGDPAAAAAFVRRLARKVYGLALATVGHPGDAQDVAQEAFVRAWRFADSFDERRGSVAAWLLGITRNSALDCVRGRGRRALPTAELPAEAGADPTDVDEVVGRHDDASRVVALMRELPAGQREALAAVTLPGLSTREVSELTGVPHGTVKTRVRLALRRLRDGLEDRVP